MNLKVNLLDILDNLNYQFMGTITKEGPVTLKLFIDGTKIEANANRYTFVWRGSNGRSSGFVIKLYSDYNSFYKIMDLVKSTVWKCSFVIGGLIKLEILLKEQKRRLQNIKSYLITIIS